MHGHVTLPAKEGGLPFTAPGKTRRSRPKPHKVGKPANLAYCLVSWPVVYRYTKSIRILLARDNIKFEVSQAEFMLPTDQDANVCQVGRACATVLCDT